MFLFNQQNNSSFKIYSLHESAVTIEFGKEINAKTANEVNSFNRLLLSSPFPGLRTTVPAYASLTVFFDPMVVFHTTDLYGIDCFDRVMHYLYTLKQQVKHEEPLGGELITIPVCYETPFAPDLEEVAKIHQLSVNEVIQLHSTTIYQVYMIGFTPGFAYLGGLSSLLETPRKASPRQKVPAGSVGIAGLQTGLYALDTPGGWQIIGRTPLPLFDPNRIPPAWLKAGDQVVFKPISRAIFESYDHEAHVHSNH